MDWIVAVSNEERAAGQLSAASTNLANAALQKNGCVLLRGAFPDPIIDGMYQEFSTRFGLDAAAMAVAAKAPPPNPFMEVGECRYEIALKMTGVFASPDVFANPMIIKFLSPLLGADLKLSGFTAVVSHPGAGPQHIHRDHAQLFEGLGPSLPVYALNVAVPLIDVDLETGPTAFWLGTHRAPDGTMPTLQPPTIVSFKRGDAILVDYRTLHAGTPNKSAKHRPVIYMVYARTWFFDEINHIGRASLEMPLATLRSLPPSTHSLLLRAYRLATLAEAARAEGPPLVRSQADAATASKL